MIRKWEY